MRRRKSRVKGAHAALGMLFGTACAAVPPAVPPTPPPLEPSEEAPEPVEAPSTMAAVGTVEPDEGPPIILPESRAFVGRPGPGRVGRVHRTPFGRPEECFDDIVPAQHVRERISRNRGRFLHCYVDALRRDPTIAGRVAVAFTVNRDGVVQDVEVESDEVLDALLADCLGEAMTGVRFLCGNEAVRVRYPLVFTRPGLAP
ncbi:MAG: AgmX/PglI C-terminal domain-containing protein [Deltaproteobacteria bacterium]|nr:AgmX/PglI C-terminal domain-containing protein [Deltaproteobacteria bacterium]